MAILSHGIRRFVKSPSSDVKNAHITRGFKIRNPKQIKRKMLLRVDNGGLVSSSASVNQVKTEREAKSNKGKMSVGFLLLLLLLRHFVPYQIKHH